VTRDDAELLFNWLCRHYGYPGESERSPRSPLPDGNDSQRRNDDANRDPDHRVRGHKNPEHDERDDQT
jgi:hypothetical protein